MMARARCHAGRFEQFLNSLAYLLVQYTFFGTGRTALSKARAEPCWVENDAAPNARRRDAQRELRSQPPLPIRAARGTKKNSGALEDAASFACHGTLHREAFLRER